MDANSLSEPPAERELPRVLIEGLGARGLPTEADGDVLLVGGLRITYDKATGDPEGVLQLLDELQASVEGLSNDARLDRLLRERLGVKPRQVPPPGSGIPTVCTNCGHHWLFNGLDEVAELIA